MVVKTWLNGWTTRRRFCQEQLPCRFCADQADEIEHYLQCSLTRQAWLERFSFISDETSRESFLLLSSSDDGLFNSHIIVCAVFLDSLHTAFQQQRQVNKFLLQLHHFKQICVVREQALGERRQDILRAVLYAKSGTADVFNGTRPRQRNARSRGQPVAVPARAPVVFRQGADLRTCF